MFELDLPWWQFPLHATLVYVTLLVLVRLSGRRTVGQFTPFDLILPPYFRTRTIRNVASARSEQSAVGQRDAA